MSFDLLFQEVGENSRYQILYILFLGLGKLAAAMTFMSPIFTAYDKSNFWCSSWGNETSVENMCNPPVNISFNESSYHEICPESDWRFNNSIFTSTIQSQYLLICDRAYLGPMTITLFICGVLVGCTFYGYLSDKYGRIKILLVVGLHGLVVGCATPFAPNIAFYSIGRFLSGCACGGLMTIVNITVTEMTTTRYRVVYVVYCLTIWLVGDFVLVLVSFLQRRQTYLEVIIASFYFLPITAFFILPECPRWLVCNGQYDETFKVMKRFGVITQEKFDELSSKIEAEIEKEKMNKKSSKFEFLRFKNMRQMTLILWFLFLSVAFLYYAFGYSSAKFGGDPHLSSLIMLTPKIPEYALFFFTSKKIDRLSVMSSGFFIGSICCFVLALLSINSSFVIVNLVIATAAYFMFGIVFSTAWLYIVEAYPTEVRNTGVGTVSTMGRVGALLSPQIIQIAKFWKPLPFIIYGIVALIISIVTLILPETRGIPTLDSLVDGENFAKGPNGGQKCLGYCGRLKRSRKEINQSNYHNDEGEKVSMIEVK